MKWKEFLKPDWRKIVLTILIAILLLWIIFSIISESERAISAVTGISLYEYCCRNLFEQTPEFCKEYTPEKCEEISFSILKQNLIFNLLVIISTGTLSYSLSCLIVWIYDKKFRKAKKK